MTRRATAESLPAAPPAPDSATRAKLPSFRFVWRRPGQDDLVVEVPRRYEGQGAWPNGEPRMVEQDDAALDRAIRLHAERVAAGTRDGARDGATFTGRPEHPRVDAKRLRALLRGAPGPMSHHDVAAELGIAPEAAASALTHLRNSGHIHRAGSETRARKDGGGPREAGRWELTNKGMLRAVREAEGKRCGRIVDSYSRRREA